MRRPNATADAAGRRTCSDSSLASAPKWGEKRKPNGAKRNGKTENTENDGNWGRGSGAKGEQRNVTDILPTKKNPSLQRAEAWPESARKTSTCPGVHTLSSSPQVCSTWHAERRGRPARGQQQAGYQARQRRRVRWAVEVGLPRASNHASRLSGCCWARSKGNPTFCTCITCWPNNYVNKE